MDYNFEMDYNVYLRTREFGIAFNLISCLAIVLVITPPFMRLFSKFWLYKPLIHGVIMLAISRLGSFYIWLQRNNGNPDSGEEGPQWFIPLCVMILICLCCLFLSIISIRRYSHNMKRQDERLE